VSPSAKGSDSRSLHTFSSRACRCTARRVPRPRGRRRLLATVPAGGRLETIRLAPTRANGQPALTAFDAETNLQPYGLMVFTMDTDHITSITGFQALHSDILNHAFAVDT
jgi:hypothetical protein